MENNEQARGIDEITGENSGIPDSARRRVNPVARRRAVDVGTAMAVIDPLLPFRTLAILPLIDLTADIRREGRGAYLEPLLT